MNGSKEGQDRFAEIINEGRKGFFLDLGCAHPSDGNNTWRLERNGWRGVLIDNNRNAIDQCHLKRDNPAFCYDLAKFDLSQFLWNSNLPMVIDYVSLDIDDGTIPFIEKFDWDHKHRRFRCMTFEHDSYGVHFEKKEAMMKKMASLPHYQMLAENVTFADENLKLHPWEDWWVCVDLIPEKLRNLRLKNLPWEVVLATMSDTLR